MDSLSFWFPWIWNSAFRQFPNSDWQSYYHSNYHWIIRRKWPKGKISKSYGSPCLPCLPSGSTRFCFMRLVLRSDISPSPWQPVSVLCEVVGVITAWPAKSTGGTQCQVDRRGRRANTDICPALWWLSCRTPLPTLGKQSNELTPDWGREGTSSRKLVTSLFSILAFSQADILNRKKSGTVGGFPAPEITFQLLRYNSHLSVLWVDILQFFHEFLEEQTVGLHLQISNTFLLELHKERVKKYGVFLMYMKADICH